MMKRIFLFILFAAFTFCFVRGQKEEFFRLSWENLPQKYGSKQQRVENLLNKSTFYFQKAGKAEDELINYKESAKTNPMRQIALQERECRLYLKAYSFIEDAYRIQYNLLEKILDAKSVSDFDSKKKELEKQFLSGFVLRRKGESVVPGMNPSSFLAEATEQQSIVLERMDKLLKGEKIEEGRSPGNKDSVFISKMPVRSGEFAVGEADSSILVPGLAALDSSATASSDHARVKKSVLSVKPEEYNAVEASKTEDVAEKTENLFYSIQFLAMREKVSDKEIAKIYNGTLTIIRNRSDGWYRFAAGKFDTVNDALSAMKRENIHGFVVAFRGDERISISDAKRLK
jgi:hypothetical protein